VPGQLHGSCIQLLLDASVQTWGGCNLHDLQTNKQGMSIT
jgi:hypothetical protein